MKTITIKVFKLNEYDYVAAETMEDAKKCLAESISNGVVDQDFEDEYIDSPHELTEIEMDKMKLSDLDDPNKKDDPAPTFKQALQDMIESGETFPTYFASSEY